MCDVCDLYDMCDICDIYGMYGTYDIYDIYEMYSTYDIWDVWLAFDNISFHTIVNIMLYDIDMSISSCMISIYRLWYWPERTTPNGDGKIVMEPVVLAQ